VFQGTNIKYSLDKEAHHGYKKPEDKRVNESKKDEETKCNMSEAGSWCPMHEMADCSKMTKINEISKSTLGSYIKKSSQDLKNIEAGREKGDKCELGVCLMTSEFFSKENTLVELKEELYTRLSDVRRVMALKSGDQEDFLDGFYEGINCRAANEDFWLSMLLDKLEKSV
jgi:hypothetical protein